MEGFKINPSKSDKLVRHERVLEDDVSDLRELLLLARLLVPHHMAGLNLTIGREMLLE